MRGGLALGRAARYTSADFPTSGAEGRPTMRAGRADGPSAFSGGRRGKTYSVATGYLMLRGSCGFMSAPCPRAQISTAFENLAESRRFFLGLQRFALYAFLACRDAALDFCREVRRAIASPGLHDGHVIDQR
jgi:hypothetical protein